MSTNDSKRYYWLKLKKDFFQQHQIKVLKSLPNGRLYALIYLELLAESTSHNGELRYSQMLPYDINTLASVIDEDVDNLKGAIELLMKLELVEILEDKTIYMREINKLIGSETGQTIRKNKAKVEGGKTYPKITLENRDKSIEKRDKNICITILDYLNENANKKYKPVESNLKFIRARLNAGYTEQDLKKVIDIKCSQWLNDKKMNQYLRPETLFNATKFESYMQEEEQQSIKPVYDTSNNIKFDEEAYKEIMRSLGRGDEL